MTGRMFSNCLRTKCFHVLKRFPLLSSCWQKLSDTQNTLFPVAASLWILFYNIWSWRTDLYTWLRKDYCFFIISNTVGFTTFILRWTNFDWGLIWGVLKRQEKSFLTMWKTHLCPIKGLQKMRLFPSEGWCLWLCDSCCEAMTASTRICFWGFCEGLCQWHKLTCREN